MSQFRMSDLSEQLVTAATAEIDGAKGAESAERQARAAVAAALRRMDAAGWTLIHGHDVTDVVFPHEWADMIEQGDGK